MSENNVGIQPLDKIMKDRGLSNADLVKASTEQLTFKKVQKGRKGRRLTLGVQNKILQALRNASPEDAFNHEDVFNY